MRIERVATAHQADAARALVREYMLSWGIEELTDPELLDELARLDEVYGTPERGCTLLALLDEQHVGVVAFKGVDERTCEMKRMYVRPGARRGGIGRALAVALMAEAAGFGYKRMRLDTPSANGPALAMYRSLGFVDRDPYFEVPPDHPIQEWTCLAADLVTER